MKKQKNQPVVSKDTSKGEIKLMALAANLVRSDLEWLGRGLMKLLRIKWEDRTIQREHGPKGDLIPLPTGPFVTTRKRQLGDLLLWVPRRFDSYMIDDLTGGYGYSHTTIDTGEIDLPTRKPVMAEITVGETVTRKFQDQYGQRAFARLPLSKIGVNVKQFVECVKSKMGEQYDNWDALTLGEISDPAKEVCSGLAADCLPEKERQRISWARRLGLLPRTAVSVHSKPTDLKSRAFISPNGFAEYYGAPEGKDLSGPNMIIIPEPMEISVDNIAAATARHQGWKVLAGLAAFAALLVLFSLPSSKRKGHSSNRLDGSQERAVGALDYHQGIGSIPRERLKSNP